MRRTFAAVLVLLSLAACTPPETPDAADPTAPPTTTDAQVSPVVECDDLVGTTWLSVQELLGGEAPGGGYPGEHWRITFDSANDAFWWFTDTGRSVEYTCTDGALTTTPQWLDLDPEFIVGTAGEVLLRWDGDLYERTEIADPSATTSPATAPRDGDGTDIVVGDFEDFERFDVVDALDSLLNSDAIVEATAVEIGRCCENPILRVEDVETIGAHDGRETSIELHSQGYQAIYSSLHPGDRFVAITRFDVTQLVFDTDGRLLHPVPQGMADALDLVMERETSDNPLEAVRRMWARYNSPLWYTGPGSLADVYLQGEPGFEDLNCSAADLGGDAEDIIADYVTVEVPDAVADTRAALITSSITCDFETLLHLTGTDQPDDGFWWGANASVHDLQVADREGALRMLVFALAATNPAVVQSTDESAGTITYYQWPAAAELEDRSQLDDEQLRLLSLMNGMSEQQFVEAWDLFGGYGLFRVGIDEDGTWLFALSGDRPADL